MERLFSSLSRAVEGAPAAAMVAAFVWGLVSVLLSPCHLSSIPLIVGFVNGRTVSGTRRAFGLSLAFAGGILVTITGVGLVTAALGRLIGDVGSGANYFLAGIFFVVGLSMLDVIALPWSGPGQVSLKWRGPAAALLLGLVFGLAVGPCTFAYMAPILGVTFKVAATNLAYGVLLLSLFAVGHCSVIVLAGTCAGLVQRYMKWNEKSHGVLVLRKVCGTLVIIAGLYLIYKAG